MSNQSETPADEPEDTPDFELPRHGAISEDNWAEYQARGFVPIWNGDGSTLSVGFAQDFYGVEHVYTGDAYDEGEQRPLRHKPGVGLYSDPDGVAFHAEQQRKWKEWHRERAARQQESDSGPSIN